MEVRLISQDGDLYRMCREVLNDLPDHHCTISIGTPEEAVPPADLWIWDFQIDSLIPTCVGSGCAKQLFLVSRQDLALFRERIGLPGAHILLKPVTRATLAAFLGLEISTHVEKAEPDQSLRADRDEILQCLIQTNLRLQEYDQDRTTFLARAVHDFRAPLTALGGYCGLLLSEPVGPLNETQRQVLERMQHSAKRLSRMALAMFELSIGRQIKKRPELKKGDLRACLDQALHETAPFADDKSIAITSDLESCEYPLFFEAGQIEQVLINLLDNACKFAPKEGSIEIRGYPCFWERRTSRAAMPPALVERRQSFLNEPNAYRIDIRDSGAPIPREHLHSIFEEYTSYSGGRDRSGGGLGLAITKMIISQHDGSVWAENSDLGPQFSLMLPVYRHEPRDAAKSLQIAV
jgi:signal transduction histidine kinase